MTNEYGLDTDYFRRKLKLVLKHLDNYTPEELARELVRMALTAHITATKEELKDRGGPMGGDVVGSFNVALGKTLNEYVLYETGLIDGDYHLVAIPKELK